MMARDDEKAIVVIDEERIIEEIEHSTETRLEQMIADRIVTTQEVCTALEILIQLAETLPRLYQMRLEMLGEDTGNEESARSISAYESAVVEYYKRIIIGDNTNTAMIEQYSERTKYISIPKNALVQIQRVLGLAVNKMDREKQKEDGFYKKIKEEAEREQMPFTETALRGFVQMDMGKRNTGDSILLGLSDPGYCVMQCFLYVAQKYCEAQSI